MIAIVILAAVMGVVLPLQSLWRLRSPERRRDEQLAANAQPRLAVLSHVLGALIGLSAAIGCSLAAIAGYSFFWAAVWLGAGIFVSTMISAAVVFRAPAEPE